MFFENIKLTFSNLRSNKMRSILSLLGIIIGVSSVVMITTLGKSASMGIKEQISSAGISTIMIMKGWGKKSVDSIFKPELADEIMKEIEGIDSIMPVAQNSYTISSRDKSGDFNIIAVPSGYAAANNYDVDAGSFLTSNDDEKRRQSIVLGSELAATLFPAGHAVGKTVRLIGGGSRSFTIKGIMKPKSASMGGSFNDRAFIPYSTFTKKMHKIESVPRFLANVKKGSNAVLISEKIKDYLFTKTQDRDSFYVESPSSMMKMFTRVTSTLNLGLGGIAAISLLVGGIGIMNIMLVSVTERTREIGIRKALGAKPSVIKGQFLTESITLTITGGIIGIIVGTGFSRLITYFLKWDYSPEPKAYVIAILFSSFIGIFFGFYPAAKASKMDPIEALSYE